MGVNGNGSYSSKPITPAAAGTYHGEAYFADYDGQNTSASSGDCNYVVQVLTRSQLIRLILEDLSAWSEVPSRSAGTATPWPGRCAPG